MYITINLSPFRPVILPGQKTEPLNVKTHSLATKLGFLAAPPKI